MKVIYVGCPANRFTGGPTLAHQLCYKLKQLGFKAIMYYYNIKDKTNIVHPGYNHFHNEFVTRISDSENNIVIAPETNTNLLKGLKNSTNVIWWMSVDNYFDKFITSKKNMILNVGGLLKYNIDSEDTLHFVQSQYAFEFLIGRKINKNRIYYLSDYLNDIFIKNAVDNQKVKKKDYILYSPKRGLEFTKLLMAHDRNIKWKALENMSQEEMVNLFKESKLYVDFGNHPGKDRIPREAAINGCCVITSRRGSAGNNVDVNIPDQYKFCDSDKSINDIVEMIHAVLDEYPVHYPKFEEYRNKIKNEENKFEQDVANIFNRLAK